MSEGDIYSLNDPHVESLTYDFEVLDNSHDFSNAEPMDVALPGFQCRLEGAKLRVTPLDHYSDVDEVQAVLEKRLEAWEVVAEIERDVRVKFWFVEGWVADRQPDPEGAAGRGTVSTRLTLGGSGTLVHSSYPAPPPDHFAASDLVQVLRRIYGDHRTRGQRLLVSAQLALTKLEHAFGGRKKAAKALGICSKVLRKLGELGNRHDPVRGRKFHGSPEPLIAEEVVWVNDVLRLLPRRAGEVASGAPDLPFVRLSDLPPLPAEGGNKVATQGDGIDRT